MKATNNDSKHLLMHSKYYRLNTFNSKRLPQILFEHSLCHMPNFKVFSLTNISHAELAFKFSKSNSSSIQLFKIRLEQADVHQLIDNRWKSVHEFLLSSESTINTCQSALEDLKWGTIDNNNNSNTSTNTNTNTSTNNNRPSHHFHRRKSFGFNSKPGDSSIDPLSRIDPLNNDKSIKSFINHMEEAKINIQKSLSDEILPQEAFSTSNRTENKVVRSLDAASLEFLVKSDTGRFPVDIVENFRQLKNSSQGELQNSIRKLKNLYKQFHKSMSGDFLEPLEEVVNSGNSGEFQELGQLKIPAGETCYMALVLCPAIICDDDDEENKSMPDDFLHVLIDPPSRETILPRLLPIVILKVMTSSMAVVQKHISFGKTFINAQTKKIVTLVNKSNIPCIFSISKSGSISSNYLFIPMGRKGWIDAMGSIDIDFFFKPHLPGTFEETLTIENIFNPFNCQSIVIKAKVVKKESFILSAINTCIPSIKVSDDFSDDVSINPCSLVIGQRSDRAISFKIKNVYSKRRQFILDGSHNNAIVANVGSNNNNNNIFEPIPETLQSIVALRCKFHSMKAEKNTCTMNGGIEGKEAERNKLKDDLEHFQQKLKIAIRKNK